MRDDTKKKKKIKVFLGGLNCSRPAERASDDNEAPSDPKDGRCECDAAADSNSPITGASRVKLYFPTRVLVNLDVSQCLSHFHQK